MFSKLQHLLDRLAYALLALFALDRLLKLLAVAAFFRRQPATEPERWPTVTLLQPITHGASALRANLRARARLDYPAAIQHLLICDHADADSQAVCRALLAEHPALCAAIVLVSPDGGEVASKIAKLRAALPQAVGEVLCFVDDDVGLRPEALRTLVRELAQPRAGATFGLACYTDWRTPWSSLMSAFVNANALLSYIPLTYLAEPFTITGHCFALRRAVFEDAGGFDGMERRLGDDHELARRLRRIGLRAVQTQVIYDVENRFDSAHAYAAQIKRWFVFPRQALLPWLTPRERAVSFVGSIGNLLPSMLGLLALLRRRAAIGALGASLGLFGAVYLWCEARYLDRRTPPHGLALLPIVALITPLQVVAALLAGDEVEWRGQQLRVYRGGEFDVLHPRRPRRS